MHSTHKIAYVYKLIEILNLVACIFASVVQHEKHGGGFMQSYNAQSIEILNFQSTEFVACVFVCVCLCFGIVLSVCIQKHWHASIIHILYHVMIMTVYCTCMYYSGK